MIKFAARFLKFDKAILSSKNYFLIIFTALLNRLLNTNK